MRSGHSVREARPAMAFSTRPCVPLVSLAIASFTVIGPRVTADDAVTWSASTGVSVSGSSLAKSGKTDGWDAAAASVNLLRDGYGYVEFTPGENQTRRRLGVSHVGPEAPSADVDFAIELGPGGAFEVSERGATRFQSKEPYAAVDRF